MERNCGFLWLAGMALGAVEAGLLLVLVNSFNLPLFIDYSIAAVAIALFLLLGPLQLLYWRGVFKRK